MLFRSDKLADDTKPDGKRTDFGTMLSRLYDRHQGERLLREIGKFLTEP